jgi:SAM-dependent methyltransferase
MEQDEYARMDAAEEHMWWYRALHLRLEHALAPCRGAVLDAGCGTGGLLARLAARRPDLALIGLDADASAASRARAKSGAPLARGSVNALPFADASFAALVAADVLCHAGVDPALALAEFARVLRPGGRLVLNMPAYGWMASAHDRRVHNARRWNARETGAALVRAGFAEIRLRYWNSLLFPLMLVHRLVTARDAATGSDVVAFPRGIDAAFFAATGIERRLPFTLPFGGSVLATARRS